MLLDFNYLVRKYNIKPDGVLHVGGNKAQERDSYAAQGIKNVIWIEAIPSVFEELCDNIKEYEGHIAIKACVTDKDGDEVEFNISNNEAQSSSILEFNTHTTIHPDVFFIDKIKLQTHRIDTLLKDSNLEGRWMLNVDLQGVELSAMIGMGSLMDKFDWVYSEVNIRETYKGCSLVQDIDTYLSVFGLKRVETSAWVGGSWGDALYVKNK